MLAELDVRAQRGLAIVNAKRQDIREIVSDKYLVPSQTLASGGYVVDVPSGTCTCPDYAEHGGHGLSHRCKHLWAVLYLTHLEAQPDGTTIVTTTPIIYKRDWSAYNAGQRDEQARVQILLAALCEGIQQPAYKGNGRPALALADVVYAAAMKVYSGMSARRATGQIEWGCGKSEIEAPSFNSVFRYMASPALTPPLQVLISESAQPLAALETDQRYAADATGFATRVYGSYCEHRHGATKEQRKAKYIKAHIMAGTTTHVVTHVVPTQGFVNDCPVFPELVERTAERIKIAEVSADKGYLSAANAEVVAKVGAVPYICFKDNSKGGRGSQAWNTMWHLFCADREEFLRHYHERSNVEAVFAAVKAKFGERLRSKVLPAQFNEVLLKFLCHSLSCLAMAIHTLGIEPKFERIFSAERKAA